MPLFTIYIFFFHILRFKYTHVYLKNIEVSKTVNYVYEGEEIACILDVCGSSIIIN